jgi:hypothetical protein
MQVFFSKIFDTFLKIQKRAQWSLCSKTIFWMNHTILPTKTQKAIQNNALSPTVVPLFLFSSLPQNRYHGPEYDSKMQLGPQRRSSGA